MSFKTINRLSPDSIRSVDDARAWARQYETRMESKMDQMGAQITELRDNDKKHNLSIAQAFKLIAIASIGFGSVLMVVVVLSGVSHILKAWF